MIVVSRWKYTRFMTDKIYWFFNSFYLLVSNAPTWSLFFLNQWRLAFTQCCVTRERVVHSNNSFTNLISDIKLTIWPATKACLSHANNNLSKYGTSWRAEKLVIQIKTKSLQKLYKCLLKHTFNSSELDRACRFSAYLPTQWAPILKFDFGNAFFTPFEQQRVINVPCPCLLVVCVRVCRYI